MWEMPELLLYFSTAACWLVLSGLAWRASRPMLAAGGDLRADARPDMRVESFLAPIALVLHAMPRSWRFWIAARLAEYLAASDANANDESRSRFALERLALDGVDTRTWVPAAGMWNAHA